jgi:cholinesterase
MAAVCSLFNPTKSETPKLTSLPGFTIGNTNSPFYTGRYFAEAEDIVVVTVNYRVNIFGFPGAPGEPHNLGLRDQRLAVEWVRDNIGAFGGDKDRIVIAGQSSGGVAADYWAYAYESDPIAAGLILVSGNAFSFPVNAPDVPLRNWNTVVGLLGCNETTTTDAEVLACMRSKDWQDIKAAAATVRPAPSTSILRSIPPFYPHPDGELVFDDYVSLTASGAFARIPVLGGHNHYEAGYYRIRSTRSTSSPSPAPSATKPRRASSTACRPGRTATLATGTTRACTRTAGRTTAWTCT